MSAGGTRLKPKLTVETTVSRYERVSGMVTAIVSLLGFCVTIMFLIWLSEMTLDLRVERQALVSVEEGEDEKPLGEAQDIEEPGSEFPEVDTPQLADSLEALTSAVSSISASDREVDGSAAEMGAGRGLGTRNGGGLGNGKGKGPWERWEIRYTTASQQAYAAQLDSLGIELGAISRDSPQIVYLQNLSTNRSTRAGRKSEEKRVFFNYNQGVLQKWDQDFMAEAGIDLRNKILVQFYPPQIQQTLLQLEQRKLGGRNVDEVFRTVFGVRPAGGGYEFYVIDQSFK
ncbi:MAG TPA: hypothetical protein PLI18_00115 [Pirellulaceae bacterium]|nr:hypothetical protein [Pirellulaceae bacterium]